MRTLHVGLRVSDPERSVGFYAALGYEVVGGVPGTELGDLTMLQLPDDPHVALELVHDAGAGPVHVSGFSHLVVNVDDVRATVARLAAEGIETEPPGSPDGSEHFWTALLTDPDGYRIALVQWPPGHPAGMTRDDLVPPAAREEGDDDG